MGRALGVDLGSKRIGIAVSDSSGTIATPLTVVIRSGRESDDHREIVRIVAVEECDAVVIGLPLTLTGETGPAARAAVSEARRLATVCEVPVYLHDERLTTVQAERPMREMRMNAQARRRVIDKVAAAVMLQSWLESEGPRTPVEPPT